MFAVLPGTRSFTENEDAKIINTVSLEDGVNINILPEDRMFVEYGAPNGTMEIYETPTKTGTSFDVGIGWKTATNGTLYKNIKIEK